MKKITTIGLSRTIILAVCMTIISSNFPTPPSAAASSKSARLEKIILSMQQRRATRIAKTHIKTVPQIKNVLSTPAAIPTSAPIPTQAQTPIPTPVVTPIAAPTPTPAIIPPPLLPTMPDLNFATPLHNGLYVWHATDLLANPDAWIAKLQAIDIGGGQKINEIYLTAYHGTYASLAAQYQTAIAKLHAANYQVYMLAGNYDWALPATWNWINTNYVPLAANFDGVMLDVEPWTTTDVTTKTWWTSAQAPQDFQNFLNNWKTAIGPTKKLTLSIANWHDVIVPSQMNLLANIYTSNADFITIMDYSTSDYISRVAYETSLSKPTSIAFDIDKNVTPDPAIIFYTLADLRKAVTTTLQAYPGIRGFSINDQELLTLGN